MSLAHHLYTFDGGFYRDITPLVQRYQHEHTAFGPHVASFTIEADKDILKDYYTTALMFNLKTYDSGIKTWDGYVWEQAFDAMGFVRTRTMQDVTNKVCVSAPDANNPDTRWYTFWQSNTDSQSLYGVHEHVEFLQSKAQIVMVPKEGGGFEGVSNDGKWLWEHDVHAQMLLDTYSYPTAVYSGFDGTDKPSLTVRCVGRSVIANRVKLSDGYLTDGTSVRPDGTNLRDSGVGDIEDLEGFGFGYGTASNDGTPPDNTYTVSQEIRRIVGVIENNTGWLYALDISQSNDTQTAAGVPSQTSAVDRLRELAELPDSRGNKYEIFITLDGGVIYRQQETEPRFYMYPNGLKYPGGVRDVGWQAYIAPIKIVDPIISLSGGTLVRPERVVVANGKARFTQLERNADDLYMAIQDNKEWVKRKK